MTMRCALLLILSLMLVTHALVAPVMAGSIEATLRGDVAVHSVSAVGRLYTDIGVYDKPQQGRIEAGRLIIDNLPPGKYDLQIDTAHGRVQGWDSAVPESDYVEEQPLSDESRRAICEKLAKHHHRQFFDEVLVLDIVGNVQHAAVLVTQLRRQPFVGGAYQPGEWVWRVDRWQYENPEELNWVPYQERPFYALFRERLDQKTYEAKRIVFARHLGGIAIEGDEAVDLGIIDLPLPRGGDAVGAPGISAVHPDGTPTAPIQIKPDRIDQAFEHEGPHKE